MRRALGAVLALLLLPGAGLGNRDRPSNKVTSSIGGAICVVSRWIDDFNDFRPEFEREFVLPEKLSVPQLDLFFDLKPPATVDLRLRSITDVDRSLFFRYKDLRAYNFWLYYLESSFFDAPQLTPSQRRWLVGDFYLRRFTEHPVHFFGESLQFRGRGLFLTRNHDFSRAGVNADLRTDFGRIAIEVPHFDFEDRDDRRYDVRETSYRAGYHKAWRDYFLSAQFSSRLGELPFFRERYTFDDVNVDALANRVFGFKDLDARMKLHYRWRPDEVVRNFHVVNGFLGDIVLSLTPIERSSVQVGVTRKTVDTLRLNRPGINELDRIGVPSMAQLRAVNGYEANEAVGVESWIKLFFNSWRRLSGHYRFSQGETNHLPPTDVTEFGATILLPHTTKTSEYRASFTPGRKFGVNAHRTAETRVNHNRDITTRYDYNDVYGYLITFEKLTLGAGVSWWRHFTSRLIFDDQLNEVKTETFDLSWNFGTGFTAYTNLRHLGYEGAREATQHIAETGLRFANSGRSGFDGRVSVTYDGLKDLSDPRLSYRQTSLNVGGTARF